MEQQPTLAGIGSTCYIILKDDLQPDGMTPKEGKSWTKVKLDNTQTRIDVKPVTPPFEIPIPSQRDFCQTFEMPFEVERKQNCRIHSMVEYSEENLQDCERLLRTWRPRLIARKKLLRASVRLSLAVLSWLNKQEPSIDRMMGIQVVSDHISRMRLLLGKKVWAADAINQESKHIYAIYFRLHRHKVVGVCAKHKGNKAI